MFNVPWAVQCPCGIQLYHLSSVLPPPPPPSLTLILLELLTIFNILRETDHVNFYSKLLKLQFVWDVERLREVLKNPVTETVRWGVRDWSF